MDEKKRLKKIDKFLRLNKVKVKIFLIIISISILFQFFDYYSSCFNLVCEPYLLWSIYYLFWPIDLILILIAPSSQIGIIVAQLIRLAVQVFYWYILTCLISIPINKIRAKIGMKKSRKRKWINKVMKQRIFRDVTHAEELEKEKMRIKKNRK